MQHCTVGARYLPPASKPTPRIPTHALQHQARLSSDLHLAYFCPSLLPFPPCFAPQVQKYVLAQYAAILPNDAAARKAFMQTGLLQRVQELKLSAGPKVAESISRINAAFPTECVKFSDPSYARELVSKLEE